MFEMPEEMREQLRKQHEEHQMQTENYYHSVQHLFDELNKEQLMTLRWILHNLQAEETGRLAAYYEGQIANTLQYKHDVCPGCGKNHEEEMLAAATVPPAERPAEEPVNADVSHAGPSAISDETRELMRQYSIDDAWDQETGKFLGFICTKGCGMMYPSLEDRMLRPADHCAGCIQKAKWG